MARHKKSTLVIWMEYIPFLILYQFIHVLPLKAAYALSSGLLRLLYGVDLKHRRRAVQHLLHAGVAANPAEARRLARKTFVEFGRLLVEIVKMDQLYRPEKVRLAGAPDALAYALNQEAPNRNVIIVTAHYGNWEVAGTAFSEKARIDMLSIMRPFGNPKIGDLILRHRRSKVHQLVNKEGGLRPLLKALRDGRNISILIDQHAATNEGVETTFFGHPCRTHMTPALLHLKTGVPILPELTRRAGRDFEFELVVGDLIRYTPTDDKDHDIREITQMCTTALEKLIAEQPSQWMWAARRWLDINRGPWPRSVPVEEAPEAERQ